MKHTFICVGKLKAGQEGVLYQRYTERLRKSPKLIELTDSGNKQSVGQAIINAIPKSSFVIALDETGKSLSSPELATKIQEQALLGDGHLCWIIGGADGLSNEVRQRAALVLSFGKLTWPHQLVRVLLAEQVYRVQTIIDGHPYHRS